MIRTNIEKMQEYGFAFDSLDDVLYYAESILEWLESHNKNYTKEQYHKILTLKQLSESLEVE